MAKAFTKGDLVHFISVWDRKGTVVIRPAIVHSCGAKRMILIDAETGDEMGRNFKPVRAERGQCGTFPRMDADEIEAVAMEAAEAFLEAETARLLHCRDVAGETAGEGYRAAIQKDLDALHEPRAEYYHEALAKIRAACA